MLVGSGLPPEALADVFQPLTQSLAHGSIACSDGSRAIEGAVQRAKKGAVPLAVAIHGRKPRKQFTALKKLDKTSPLPALHAVLSSQGRVKDSSVHVRICGGNQAAESEWGCANQLLKARFSTAAVPRGMPQLTSHLPFCWHTTPACNTSGARGNLFLLRTWTRGALKGFSFVRDLVLASCLTFLRNYAWAPRRALLWQRH